MSNSLDLEEKKAIKEIRPEVQKGSPSLSKETLDPEVPDEASIAESQLPPPPDGGLHAWLKVFGGFLIYINIW